MKKKTCFIILLTLFILIPVTSLVSGDIIIISDPDDLAPPDLVYFEILPDSIDTGSSDQSVKFILRITDEMSGFYYLIFYITSPSNQQQHGMQVHPYHRVSGDEYDGIYHLNWIFPQYSEAGTWRITQMQIKDQVTNTRILNTNDILDRGFSPYLYISGGPDLAPPIVMDLQIDPDTIDVSEYSKRVTFTFHITDELSGFYYMYFYLRSPSGKQNRVLLIMQRNNLVSGDANDGIYRTSYEFPEHHEAGLWSVYYLYLYDNARNRRSMNEQMMIDAGFETKIEFISDPHDIIAPVLEGLEVDPRLVDTSAGPQAIWFTFNITDHLAGFYYLSLYLTSPSGAQQWSLQAMARYDMISGDIFSGIYKEKITLPQYSETGTWRITQICLQDNVTNRRCYGYQTLIDSGFNPEVEVVDSAEAIIDFDPNALNLASEGNPVTVYIELPVDSLYTIYDIDVSTILLNEQVSIMDWPYTFGDYDQDGIPDLMIKFDRAEVQSILEVGKEIEILVSGQFTNGATFEGIDIIKVMNK